MENRLNIISQISYVRCQDILRYREDLRTSSVELETDQWNVIEKGVTPVTFQVSDEPTAAGTQYNIQMSITSKKLLTEASPVILKLEFCGAPPRLIGSPDYPVRLLKRTDLQSKKIEITHKDWHFPFEYIV